MHHRLAVVHSFDPTGTKVGGLETFIRDMLAFVPEDFSFLMIGVDSTGQRELGKITRESFRGRSFDFLPVLNFSDERAREAAKTLADSINFQFMRALLRHLPAVRAALKSQPTSVDLERVEFAGLMRGLGVPFVQMLHGEGAPKLKMDSLLKSYRYVHNFNERIAVMACDRFLCVNPIITERIRQTYPRHAHKIGTLSTWVDTKTFAPTPFKNDGTFGIAFAGRLDLFKVPSLMFKTIAALRQRLGDGVRFHYMGTSDPRRFDEFKAIEDISVLHGFKSAAGVAEVLSSAHAGILTSEFEGMPFSVLESLGCGRPVCAIHLPQLATVIQPSISGELVPRSDNEDEMSARLADAFVRVHDGIKAGTMTPHGVASAIGEFTPEKQLARCYENHREVQRARFGREKLSTTLQVPGTGRA